MKIKNKILLYFSSSVIGITAISLFVLYILFAEYREEQFQQKQNEKIKATIKLIEKYQQQSATLANFIEQQDINDFYDEKLLIYDSTKKTVFVSLDSLDILASNDVLKQLSPINNWIEQKEAKYDLVGIYTQLNNKSYYAVSKAYDSFGYEKLIFLRNTLIAIFLLVAIAVFATTQFLADKIAKPITSLADSINKYDLKKEYFEDIDINTSSQELKLLTLRFNELIQKTNEAFIFQKNTIHHISHQLKTPIAVILSELERIIKLDSTNEIKKEIESQIIKVNTLGRIINTLLEISKVESGQSLKIETTRIDELIFDCVDELNKLHPNFNFEINYLPIEINEQQLSINVHRMLIQQAVNNLLSNCIAYSDNDKAEIVIDCTTFNHLNIQIKNSGTTLSIEEQKMLYTHFFRGNNSIDTKGFGLGLALTKRIADIHSAKLTYISSGDNANVFQLCFSLS